MKSRRASFCLACVVITGCSSEVVSFDHDTSFVPALTRNGVSMVALNTEDRTSWVVPGSPFLNAGNLLARDPNGRFVYSLNAKGVVAGKIDGRTGALTLGPDPATGTLGANSLVTDPTGTFVYAAQQGNPDYVCIQDFAVDGSGVFTPLSGYPVVVEKSNCRSIAMHPTGKFIYAAEGFANGDNTVPNLLAFSVDDAGAPSKLSGTPIPAAAAADYAPSLVAVHPNGRFLYLTSDHSLGTPPSFLSVLSVDAQTGVPAVLPASAVEGREQPRALVIHPSGKYAFVGYQGHAMGVYAIDESTGGLRSIDQPGPLPEFVAAIEFDATGAFVVAGDFIADTVSVLELNLESGKLAPLAGSPFAIGH
jgi:6-phosphogluconolactonase (cycloisomerase 2 family)